MTGLRQLLCVAALGLAAGTAGAQLSYDMSSPSAREAFRTGVLAYNAGRYAESLLFFEQALATQARDATPGANGRNPLAAYWLGKSYYRLGSSSSAFSLWREAANARGPNPFLESKLELFSMMEDPEARLPTERYIRAGEISGKSGRDTLFSRPSWVEPMPDGSLFLVSHGSNALIRISTNGTISQRITGGATGFDRPFAVLPLPDGGLVLSEFQSDRLAVLDANGNVRAYLGDPDGPGRLAGPQYLCTDGAGFVYVSDVGFSRVAKFDLNGRFILSFGTRTGEFAGLKVPTGVAYLDGHIYVEIGRASCRERV